VVHKNNKDCDIRMTSVTPDLRLPSQLWSNTAPPLAPNYSAWWQRQVCEGCILNRALSGSHPRPADC